MISSTSLTSHQHSFSLFEQAGDIYSRTFHLYISCPKTHSVQEQIKTLCKVNGYNEARVNLSAQ